MGRCRHKTTLHRRRSKAERHLVLRWHTLLPLSKVAPPMSRPMRRIAACRNAPNAIASRSRVGPLIGSCRPPDDVPGGALAPSWFLLRCTACARKAGCKSRTHDHVGKKGASWSTGSGVAVPNVTRERRQIAILPGKHGHPPNLGTLFGKRSAQRGALHNLKGRC
jgi:hypothetical protein